MSDSLSTEELRRSASLLATEWWLFVGGLIGYLLYGVWVVATGIAVSSVAPSTTVTTIGGTAVTTQTVVAAVAWLFVPAVVATWFLERQLANPHGNLLKHYRLEPPGALVGPPAIAVVVFVVAAVAVGPHPAVVALGAVASTHLLVRTVAFGRRVYSFSPRRLFTLLSWTSGVSLTAAWLAHAPGLPGAAGRQVTRAGVESFVGTGTAIAGTTPATALGVLVAVPALLSGLYLLAQSVAAKRVRSQAPLADPDKRAEQRFPIMPPVPASERPGAAVTPPSDDSTADDSAKDDQTADAEAPADAAEASGDAVDDDESAADEEPEPSSDDKSQTRVFTADEPIPDGDEAATQLADEDEAEDEAEDDGWIDDTSVFSPDSGSGDSDECTACGEELPSDSSVVFCPNCGQKI